MRRREFIALIGGAAVTWPLSTSAQQSAIPVIGFLDLRSLDGVANRLRGLRQGLKETGFVEGENVAVEFRWAENQMDRLAELAADLVRRQSAVIVASGGRDSTLAAKAATTTIPIVFLTAEDPVRLGLVASLARPGGNLTGVNFFNAELTTKRLELLRELVPEAKRIAVLVSPVDAANTDSTLRAIEPAARAIGNTNPGSQCQHEPRDRCSFCYYRARPAGRNLRWSNAFFGLPARAIGAIGSPSYDSCLISRARIPRNWRANELWLRYCGRLPPSRHLYRPYSQGCEASRSPGGADEQV
jgi:putative ABC transport system substrate-binding protein